MPRSAKRDLTQAQRRALAALLDAREEREALRDK